MTIDVLSVPWLVKAFDNLVAYRYDQATNRYRDAAGRFVSYRQVYSVLNLNERASAETMQGLTQALLEGFLPPAHWYTAMTHQLQLLTVQNAALGAGGFDQLKPTDFARLDRSLREDFERLQRFGQQLSNGQVSQGQAQARVNMYAGNARLQYHKAQPAPVVRRGEVVVERRLLKPAEHCGYCLYLADLGWRPYGTLPLPGESATWWKDDQCLTNCKCEMERRTVPAAEARLLLAGATAKAFVKGGPGSGNFGHAGRPGEVGGSAPKGGGAERPGDDLRLRLALGKNREQERERRKNAADAPKPTGWSDKEIDLRIDAFLAECDKVPFDPTAKMDQVIEEFMSGKLTESEFQSQVNAISGPDAYDARKEYRDLFLKHFGAGRVDPRQRWIVLSKENEKNEKVASATQQATFFLSRLFGSMPSTAPRIDLSESKGRANYAEGVVNLFSETKQDLAGIIVHEWGHHLEGKGAPFLSPQRGENRPKTLAQGFLKGRTGKEEAQQLARLRPGGSFRADEYAKPDKFIHPYVGKMYTGGVTEVLSMGLQMTYDNAYDFAEADRDHFKLVIQTVAGYKQ